MRCHSLKAVFSSFSLPPFCSESAAQRFCLGFDYSIVRNRKRKYRIFILDVAIYFVFVQRENGGSVAQCEMTDRKKSKNRYFAKALWKIHLSDAEQPDFKRLQCGLEPQRGIHLLGGQRAVRGSVLGQILQEGSVRGGRCAGGKPQVERGTRGTGNFLLLNPVQAASESGKCDLKPHDLAALEYRIGILRMLQSAVAIAVNVVVESAAIPVHFG